MEITANENTFSLHIKIKGLFSMEITADDNTFSLRIKIKGLFRDSFFSFFKKFPWGYKPHAGRRRLISRIRFLEHENDDPDQMKNTNSLLLSHRFANIETGRWFFFFNHKIPFWTYVIEFILFRWRKRYGQWQGILYWIKVSAICRIMGDVRICQYQYIGKRIILLIVPLWTWWIKGWLT